MPGVVVLGRCLFCYPKPVDNPARNEGDATTRDDAIDLTGGVDDDDDDDDDDGDDDKNRNNNNKMNNSDSDDSLSAVGIDSKPKAKRRIVIKQESGVSKKAGQKRDRQAFEDTNDDEGAPSVSEADSPEPTVATELTAAVPVAKRRAVHAEDDSLDSTVWMDMLEGSDTDSLFADETVEKDRKRPARSVDNTKRRAPKKRRSTRKQKNFCESSASSWETDAQRQVEVKDADGLIFVGVLEEGTVENGRGKFSHTHAAGTEHAGKKIEYDGEIKDGRFHGNGVNIDHGTGCRYTGTFFNGAAHGYGKCVWEKGWEYDGEWKNDKRHGRGVCRQLEKDGEVYDGEWKSDRWNGSGSLQFAGGGRYDGEFHRDKLHGRGKYKFADGSVYDGFFKNDLREGHGEMVYADGPRYVGEWQKNWRCGKGTVFSRDGAIWKGNFRADDRHGIGFLHLPDGIVRKELWIDGVIQP